MLVRVVVCIFAGIGTLLGFPWRCGRAAASKSQLPAQSFSTTGPDATAYGADEGYPLGTRATTDEVRHLVASYSRFDDLFMSGIVTRAEETWAFQRASRRNRRSRTISNLIATRSRTISTAIPRPVY